MEIGGYFGLDLPDFGDAFPNAVKFQSARAAFRAALEANGIRQVFLPAFICDAMIRAATDAGTTISYYRLDNSLYPVGLPDELPPGCVLLYVNYFGLCGENISRMLQSYPECQVIIDNSQALLEKAVSGVTTIYSPRKFVGVPDGGMLATSRLTMANLSREDSQSLGRMKYLLLRMAYTASDGYPIYLEAESSLDNTYPLAMSRLTSRILASINMPEVARKRRENYQVLAKHLDPCNLHRWHLGAESVPLCYPFVLERNVESIKRNLALKHIYIPTYWHEVCSRVTDGIEHQLTNCCLAVPCDQRYSTDQMCKLVSEIMLALD